MIFNDSEESRIDLEGYLKNGIQWNESVGKIIAKKESIIMSQEHWKVIRNIRAFYQKFNRSPTVFMLLKYMEKKYGKEKVNSRYLFRLFPEGIVKQANKIAGLPRSSHCL